MFLRRICKPNARLQLPSISLVALSGAHGYLMGHLLSDRPISSRNNCMLTVGERMMSIFSSCRISRGRIHPMMRSRGMVEQVLLPERIWFTKGYDATSAEPQSEWRPSPNFWRRMHQHSS